MALKKCVLCGEVITADEHSQKYKRGYAHTRCFNLEIKLLSQKKKKEIEKKATTKKATSKVKPMAELQNGLSEDEYKEKQQFYEYLSTLIPNHEITAKIYIVTDNYINKYNFTFNGMYKTIVYLNEEIEKELKGDVIGLVPYYYDEAQKYFKEKQQTDELNKKKDIANMYKEKVVKISRPQRKTKEIDITLIK